MDKPTILLPMTIQTEKMILKRILCRSSNNFTLHLSVFCYLYLKKQKMDIFFIVIPKML